jgi:hypothetical protein
LKARKTRRRKVLRAGLNVLMAVGGAVLDEEARAELIEWNKPNGQPIKLGIITLPSFYGEPDRNTNPNAKSTTRDVLALIKRLKQEGIQGLVMDLRRDGGGFLDEAVSLTGLFIKTGPVVQARSWNGEVAVSRDKDQKIEYRPVKIAPDDTDVVVRSLVKSSGGGEPVQVDYGMEKTDEGWKVYNVKLILLVHNAERKPLVQVLLVVPVRLLKTLKLTVLCSLKWMPLVLKVCNKHINKPKPILVNAHS